MESTIVSKKDVEVGPNVPIAVKSDEKVAVISVSRHGRNVVVEGGGAQAITGVHEMC